MTDYAFKPPEKKGMSRRSFLTGGASTIVRNAARGLMASPEEKYYYDSFSGVAGKEIGEGALHDQAVEEAGYAHHHTHPNGTRVYQSPHDVPYNTHLLRTTARSKAEAHAKFAAAHPAYGGNPEWIDYKVKS